MLEDGAVAYLEEALKLGATVMGGIDPCQLDRDPVRHRDIVFGLAERYGVEWTSTCANPDTWRCSPPI